MDQKKQLKLPTKAEVMQIWDLYKTPLHVRKHLQQVNRVGVYLAKQLIAVGENVILDLVDRATLLHDTLRVTEWKSLSLEKFPYTPTSAEIAVWTEQRKKYPPHIPHSKINYDIFHEQYPEMAMVIFRHDLMNLPLAETWEDKIVNYADRRVEQDQIVSLSERLHQLNKRYPFLFQNDKMTGRDIWAENKKLEQEIFSKLSLQPDQLLKAIQDEEKI
ncbi:MAG: hypothetical protein A2233_03230 [Candidatus Kerfeldbacteria bacterium RIFOXYA2_FULL_38_24]|uniref:HD domain-containing protein n=1 Tax=Candidatus Kerfeldbacteria bacterium RIFOXYB2_FULL_38_14 TaxID=1798547 RepID=A0A1G2BBD0_9BACT|nr:MAG: hypothetical protein A2233_03230 [Candidatus Kerfeldbacteria bacterium RIFOXYA2_FULL_38_24]OGY86432.1 MAG: hypothetical protein A2319_01270 [Candidatus Kerfeldbacteria bacterium RIFOXYB2_FULL_38_14]